MYSVCRQTHPATGIEHSVSCCFFNNDETCLVTAGANILKVFRLFPEGDSKDNNAAGQPVPPKMKLECLASYTLWGCVMSLETVHTPNLGRDLILVSFREAKLSVLQYDPQINDLVTLSMHYFEEDDMKNGWTSHPHIPWIRVDPEGRCAVLLLYGRKLAVLPFRKDNPADDVDLLDAKPLEDVKKNQPTQQFVRSPTLASYVIVLKDLDQKIDNVLDLQFLHGYYEPTLLILYEPIRTFAGRTAVRSDTCAMAGVSVNMSARVHPVIWSTAGLPFDCLKAVPIEKPLGGVLIMAVNSLIYLNQSVPPYGVSLNSIATHNTNFPLRVQEGVSMSLDGASACPLGAGRLVLSLREGQLYVLTLLSDSVRSVRSFHLDRAASSVLTATMCLIEEDFLFLGSRLGNSLLLRVTERENRMLFTVDKPLEDTVDLTGPDDQPSEPAKKRRIVDLTDLEECAPKDVTEVSDRDELQVYGSDIRTSTMLTGYVFDVCDSLLNTCPIGSIAMGEPQLISEQYPRDPKLPLVELLACSGQGKNGALTVLQRSVRTRLVTAFDLPGCLDMWTVIGEGSESNTRDASKDMEGTHAYLILTQEDGSMILQTGQEINEVDNTGFMTSAPTIFAGNLGNNKFMVQVTTNAIRLVKNGVQIQNIQLEWTACYASTADPYLCVVSSCGRALVLALREFKTTTSVSARLAPTRQTVPHRPALIKATAYRDLSGMFTNVDVQTQVKGEFTGKMKNKKNIKAEGFQSDTVYELNDEDEMLYGGDQTPASMASIMLAEQQKNPGLPRRVSRWWRRHLAEIKPTYWLFVVRETGCLEIYSLPEMRLSYLVADVVGGHSVLTDSLESVPMPVNPESEDVPSVKSNQSEVENLQEMLVVGLGNKGSRVLMLLRMRSEVMMYQVYKYPKGNLKMRFSRIHASFAFGYKGQEGPTQTTDYYTLKDNVRQMRYFGNIAGYNGIFICGPTPYILLLTARGELRLHPLAVEEGPVVTFASFNNTNCHQGFLYFNSKDELRICQLSNHLTYDSSWPLRKVPLRMTPHRITYHQESKTYCLVASTSTPTTMYYRFNGEDKEAHQENKGDRFPYPMVEKFSVSLFSPVSWEIVPHTKIDLEPWEHVTCLETVSLSYEGTMSGLRGYIALGTNYNYGEDITSRGRIIIYDVIDVVPEPGQPLTKNKFKEIYAKEQKGPVTALTQVLGYLISAIGQKIYLWQLKDNDLIGVAFIDTQIYVHRMMSVKNLILVADVYKSVSLLRYQAQYRTLSLVSRDLRTTQIYEMQFMVDHSNLGFLVSEQEGNFVLFMYQPQARESYGGQRLIRKADYHLGQQVNAMFRINTRSLDIAPVQRHVTMYTTLDGGIGYVLPLSEKSYRRLLMLQNVLNNYLKHIAGLNPRSFRTYKSARKIVGGGPARGMLDGDLVSLYTTMSTTERQDVAKKIGTKVDEIMADLYEIDRLTAHF